MLHHADIWRAIDQLAERHGLSPSGLARKAGLSATLFNPSKRTNGRRKRWPSTESIAAILKATGSSLEDFVALASPNAAQRSKLPLIGSQEASRDDLFDESGSPAGQDWDEILLPAAADPHAFAVEINGHSHEPFYAEGVRIILSPMETPRRGDRVGVRTAKGELLFRRLGREGAQKIELLSLANDNDPPLTLARKDIDWLYRIVWASQ